MYLQLRFLAFSRKISHNAVTQYRLIKMLPRMAP